MVCIKLFINIELHLPYLISKGSVIKISPFIFIHLQHLVFPFWNYYLQKDPKENSKDNKTVSCEIQCEFLNKIYFQMNFYQQKYFKPYHQIVTSPERHQQRNFKTPSTHKYRQKQNVQYSERYNFQPAWQYLYSKGLKDKQDLKERHEATKHKIDIECTFRPLIKQNKRYLVPSHSTFLERNSLWRQNKIQKIVKQKQQEINKGLKQCTFAPNINSKPRKARPDKYQNIIHRKTCTNQKLHKSAIRPTRRTQERQNQEPLASGKKSTYVQISRAKQMIRNQLKRLVL